jgi:uncharacterized metal-binding protein
MWEMLLHHKVRIYIWYQRFIGFRGTPFWSRVLIGTVISLVTVGNLWYFFQVKRNGKQFEDGDREV